MKKPYVTLQPSEQTLLTAAATIYAAWITVGRVPPVAESEEKWMGRAVETAIQMAKNIDEAVQADKEFD